MSFFKWIFGRKSAAPETSTSASAAGTATDELVNFYDQYGREYRISKKQWRDDVLLTNLEKVKSDPDRLYSMILSAIDDGFPQDALQYARHLQKIDPNMLRATTLLGAVCLQLGRIDEAERVLLNYLRQYGEEGYLLTNLAKVYSQRGNEDQAEKTLRRALELDPNQDNAVRWWMAAARERSGEAGETEALNRIRSLPGSWRAQLWLARTSLMKKNMSEAIQLYEEAIRAAPRPIPTDFLMQMSGDLGQAGECIEALKLTLPHFDAAYHGLQVGNNLIKANLELGRIEHARAVVEQLYSLKRPDYQQHLSFWEAEIAKTRIAGDNESLQPSLSLSMLTVEGPIWLSTKSPIRSLFLQMDKDQDSVVVAFLGSSVTSSDVQEARIQMADTNGRITRALPLYLVEQTHLRTSAIAMALQPWAGPRGFVLVGEPWETEAAIDRAKSCDPPADYLVVTHLVANSTPPAVKFRILRCIDGSILSSGSTSIDQGNLEPCFRTLAQTLHDSLSKFAHVEAIRQVGPYEVPRGPLFNDYQLRLEQLLALRAAGMGDARPDFLSGEREIVAGNIFLCLAAPKNTTVRAILAETLRRMKQVHPQVVAELREKVEKLEQDQPLSRPAQDAIHIFLAHVFANSN